MIPMTVTNNAITSSQPSRLIESDEFLFEFLSAVAERESWRKEVYRPIYHIHKWWAVRLGSIFRGIILGCLLPRDGDLEHAFYQQHTFSNVAVFDPFMGSGTTIGEAHKLGCIALGRDINPVACECVRVALGPLDRRRLQDAFVHLSATVGNRIRGLYQTTDVSGQPCDVLYYFWVKRIPCPHCAAGVDLFSTRVIARNAYPDRRPEIQVCCSSCGDVFPARNGDRYAHCPTCGLDFDPHRGPARGTKATCPVCATVFSIAETVRALGRPPDHRLYAKLLLTPDGNKRYLPTTPTDIKAYQRCSDLLRREFARCVIRLPDAALSDGFNTRQAIGYNYRYWRDFFNDRQLLALGWLHQAIAELPDVSTRDAFLVLFSGVLEFNNLFASYKGEGTGAVRHMFAHHILKPERTPIEANVWGTSKSSGSFSGLFRARLLRALNYRVVPFEATIGGCGKAHHTSVSFSGEVSHVWPVRGHFEPRTIYLSCGSSHQTDLPTRSVDLVVTDPPFFDNVHYSELADFFHAWQRLYPHGFLNGATTTRHADEVQDTKPDRFAMKLRAVFVECYRVLKDDGLLVFTYHHSRAEGWISLVEAVFGAGFSIINAHPVKSEMSVAAPKSQAKEPIQLDAILICKKREQDARTSLQPPAALVEAAMRAHHKLARLASVGLQLSKNDRRMVVISQFIAALGPVPSAEIAVQAVLNQQTQLEAAADRVPRAVDPSPSPMRTPSKSQQLALMLEARCRYKSRSH
jgi:putative DNA methylase